MSKFLIYALLDQDNQARYVGMSTSGLVRPSKHFMPSSFNHKTKKHYHLYNWIRKSLNEGFKPTIKVLEECTKENLYSKEQFWISFYKESGLLTNKVDGGPGMLGLKHSEESKKLMSTKLKGKKPCKQILDMFKSQVGDKHPMYGKKHSEETLKKLVESHKGYIMPEVQKEKIAQALKGKVRGSVSVEHKNKLKEAKRYKMKPIKCLETDKIYESISEAARQLNILKSDIQSALKRQGKTKGYTFREALGL
jgi:group I intron endonuclease